MYDQLTILRDVGRFSDSNTSAVAMTVSSRTPEDESGHCPICDSNFVIDPSSLLGDATCPNCGRLIWFVHLADEVYAFNTADDRVLLRLADYLGRCGLYNTTQRWALAQLVTTIDSPFSSEQLIDLTLQVPNDRCITPATVYRALAEFVDAGILKYSGEGGDLQYTLA